MSKNTIEVYNISSDTDSTAYIQDNESSTDDDEYIINCNTTQIKYTIPIITNLFLNFPVPLGIYYFNTLTVKDNLKIDIFINCPISFIKLYNLITCNITDDYFYYIDTPKILSCSKFEFLKLL